MTAETDRLHSLRNDGIRALKSGDKQQARKLLQEVLALDPDDEYAWLWLSGAVETLDEQLHALRQVLTINPANDVAQRALQEIYAATGVLVPTELAETRGLVAPPPAAAPVAAATPAAAPVTAAGRQQSGCVLCGNGISALDRLSQAGDAGAAASAGSLLCNGCRQRTRHYQPLEPAFADYLAQVLRLSPAFEQVEPAGYGTLVASLRSPSGAAQLLIECRSDGLCTAQRIEALLARAKSSSHEAPARQHVLALPGCLAQSQRDLLEAHAIEPWDLRQLHDSFAPQIQQVAHPYFQPLLLGALAEPDQQLPERLLVDLRRCPPGKEGMSDYEQLIARILGYLFCPPLRSLALSAAPGAHRLVLANWAADGFWRVLREVYQADFVLIDLKNTKGHVAKKEALQLAQELKPYGTGLFGLIICRSGGNSGCLAALREQWMSYKKLILVLEDQELEAMLLAKAAGRSPEELLAEKLEAFRLSL